MAPVRRYLRISKYSVLECRIYLDNPSLAQSWLLHPRHAVLTRVIESIRPLILPKLREERERSKKKSNKKKGIKDVVTGDDFEVSMFLTETSTRHSLLFKHKHFRDKASGRLQSNSTKLIGETESAPLDLDAQDIAIRLEDESDEDGARLADIPLAKTFRHGKRQRISLDDEESETGLDDEPDSPIEIDSEEEQPPAKRLRNRVDPEFEEPEDDDAKKKLAMDVSYEGFAIYGQVLCLVVKKLDKAQSGSVAARASAATNTTKPSGQASMENWITSTQMPAGEEES
ncbi:hypothetical protein HJFPF1_01171 [Paramyrothecium foliicola]|nr:hypothetical protein HJFPF1_01171 [Paramyrothecium foliicola]